MMREEEMKNRKQMEIAFKMRDNELQNKSKKTYEFWLKRDNRWNIPEFASRKMFQFYHKFREEDKEKIREMNVTQKELNPYRRHLEEPYRFFVKTNKREARDRLKHRKLERLILQQACNQSMKNNTKPEIFFEKIKSMSFGEKKSKILHRSAARNMLKKKPENLWNDFNNKSDKLLSLYLRPIMLKNEDEAVERMKRKLKKRDKEDFYKRLYMKVKHDVIMHKSKSAHNKKKEVIDNPYMHFYRKNLKALMKERGYKKRSRSVGVGERLGAGKAGGRVDEVIEVNEGYDTVVNELDKDSHSLFDRLSQPKEKIHSFDIEYFDEFRDMMIRDVTPQTAYFDNNYIKTLIKISKTAKMRSLSQKRPAKRSDLQKRVQKRLTAKKAKKGVIGRGGKVPRIDLRSKSLGIIKKFKRGIRWKKIKTKLKKRNECITEIEEFEKKHQIRSNLDDLNTWKIERNMSEIKKGSDKGSYLFTKTDDVLELLPLITKDSIMEYREGGLKANERTSEISLEGIHSSH